MICVIGVAPGSKSSKGDSQKLFGMSLLSVSLKLRMSLVKVNKAGW